jgi:hypothetical protein
MAKPKPRLGANSLDHETDFHIAGGAADGAVAVVGNFARCVFRRLVSDADDWHRYQQSRM